MPVAADSELRLEPSLERARELAREGNVVPVRARFVDDCETPVSAFLKLRAGEPEGAPCFLLESAEQGQVGRYSFVGLRPRAMLRWSDGMLSEWSGEEAAAGDGPSRSEPAPDPYAAVAARLADFQPGPGRGAAAVRRRRRRLLRLRPGAHRRAARRAQPRPARPARHGADGHRRDGRLRPPAPRADDPRLRLRRRRGRHRRRLRARRGDNRRDARAPARRRPGPGEPVGRRAAAVRLQHGARGVRSRGRADRRVRPRRRRLPGRPLPALLRPGPGRGLLGLPRPARGQPLALHVLPRVRRLPDRRRLAGAAGQGQRQAGGDAADRRHLAARAQRGRGPPPRRAADQRPQGAGRARDAGRPRPQRPRPRLRVRLGQRSTS